MDNPLLNLDMLADIYSSNELLKLLKKYHSCMQIDLQQLKCFLDESAWLSVKQQSHKLKGVNSYFGAHKMIELLVKLEHATQSADKSSAIEIFGDIINCWQHVEEQLKNLFLNNNL